MRTVARAAAPWLCSLRLISAGGACGGGRSRPRDMHLVAAPPTGQAGPGQRQARLPARAARHQRRLLRAPVVAGSGAPIPMAR